MSPRWWLSYFQESSFKFSAISLSVFRRIKCISGLNGTRRLAGRFRTAEVRTRITARRPITHPDFSYPLVCRSRTPVFSRSFSLWAACCSNRCACFSAAPASCCPFRWGASAGEVKKVNFLSWFDKTSKRLTYPQKRKQTFVPFFSRRNCFRYLLSSSRNTFSFTRWTSPTVERFQQAHLRMLQVLIVN